MISADYVVVGSGLTGAVIARTLVDHGREVVVLDRRAHLGGNVHDTVHSSGIRIHTYGPHYFRTNNARIWEFVNRFASFDPFEAEVASEVAGSIERWPVSAEYIDRVAGPDWQPAFTGTPRNFEEASLAMMPAVIYERFVKPYTEKQWGVPATSLDPELAGRFQVRAGGDRRLMQHEHQGIPSAGYRHMMSQLMEGIPYHLSCDYLQERTEVEHRRKLVFTGPIDELFGFDLGRLHYRGQHREHEYLDREHLHQPVGQVNNPDPTNGAHIRTLEWKHMMPEAERTACRGTVITRETPHSPTDPGEYEYPFPDRQNRHLYRAYRTRADARDDLLVCGRLGEYRYYDMDQAIGRALRLAERLLREG